MIQAYYRPSQLSEALALISRKSPRTLPLGGGTLLSRPNPEVIEVVDLQALGLNKILKKGNTLEIGATATLQDLLDSPHAPPALITALKLEAPLNLRNAATIAGTLVVADGRSPFTTLLLAMDATLTIQPQDERIPLGGYLPMRKSGRRDQLITKVKIPLNIKIEFESVARTPGDKPLVCVALAQWSSGRTRLALGGYGPAPTLALDGTETEGLAPAARNAFHEASDAWASADYRMHAAATLSSRCLGRL